METLPEYMGSINPRRLELYCSLALLASMAVAQSGLEWDKFSHIEHVKAYAREGDNWKKWYVLYTANPYKLETNVSRSSMSREEDHEVVSSGSRDQGKEQGAQTRTVEEDGTSSF